MELEHMKSSSIVHNSNQNKHQIPCNRNFESEGVKQKAENFKSYYQFEQTSEELSSILNQDSARFAHLNKENRYQAVIPKLVKLDKGIG